jgi:hypothetical protein
MIRVDRSKLLLAAGSSAFLVAACQSVATAQRAAPAPTAAAQTYKNIQVLAPDITREQLFPIMKSFSQGLGVRCTHCHVGEEGKPATFDFASDAKKEKLVARAMLRMVHRINDQDFGVKQFSDVKVTCFTCHRGATKPLTAPPPPTAPAS